MSVLIIVDWDPVIRCAPTPMGPSSAVANLDTLCLDISAMVRLQKNIFSIADLDCTCMEQFLLCPCKYKIACSIIAYLNADINECLPNGGQGPCNQTCTNTNGSYYCSCQSGYTQSGYNCTGTRDL